MDNKDEITLFERVTRVEQSVKSAHLRIDNIEDLTKSVSDMVVEVRYMREDVNKVKKEVDDLKEKPARRYDMVINTTITVIISGLAGFLISKLFGM